MQNSQRWGSTFKFILIIWLAGIFTFSSCDKNNQSLPDPDETNPSDSIVRFKDRELEKIIRFELRLETEPITWAHMESLQKLNLNNSIISYMDGLEFAKNMDSLWAEYIKVESLLPIGSLHNLSFLSIRGTSFQENNLNFTAELNRLRFLDARECSITSLDGIQHIAPLEHLNLRDNNITQISALADLTQLSYLNLHSNSILDLSPLTELTQMEELILRNVPCGQSMPQALIKMNNLMRLNARNTGLSNLTFLGELMSKGALQDQPDGQKAEIDIRDNVFADVDALTDPYAPIRPFWSNVANRFPAILPPSWGNESYFEDPILEELVRNILSIGPNDKITTQDLKSITHLDARDLPIKSIKGLEWMPNITFLRLDNTQVSDLSPLKETSSLDYFNINTTTNIQDISPLENHANLGTFIARNVPFGDKGMQTISRFTKLHRLNMRNTGVTDLSPLASLMAQGALQNSAAPLGNAILDIRQLNVKDYCVIFPFIQQIADLSGGDFSNCE